MRCRRDRRFFGCSVPPPLPTVEDPSYVQCPCCLRKFNEQAGARHIPLCKGQAAKPTRLLAGGGISAGRKPAQAPAPPPLQAPANGRR